VKIKKLLSSLNLSLPSNACFNTQLEDMTGETWVAMHGSDFDPKRPLPKVKKTGGVLYAVSTYGRIKKISPSGEKILAQTLSLKGNLPQYVIGTESFFTQEIVAKTYDVPNALNLPVLGHVNGIYWDNRPENLEYCEINSDELVFPYTTCNFKLLPTHANYNPYCKVSDTGVRLAAYENLKPVGDIRGTHRGYSWMPLRDYIRLPRFREQAAFVVNQNNRKHPWLL